MRLAVLKPFVTVLFLALYAQEGELAVVIVPIADLAGQSLATLKGPVTQNYLEDGFSPDRGRYACIRVHQLKFNEVVSIVSDATSEEVECKASNFYYLDEKNIKRSNLWMLKDNLIPLKKLAKKINIMHIPAPIEHAALEDPLLKQKKFLTLMFPWYDDCTKKTYSVGTCFVRCPRKDTQATYAVYVINTAKLEEVVAAVPKDKALVNYPATPEKARALFVRLIKKWAHQPSGIIPYVYGGCSFTGSVPDKGFYRNQKRKFRHPVLFWQRKGSFKKPLAGFDCSGLVLTAAQIAGIPYYCKNTHALVERLRPLEKGEELENGDLIWYNHHVMVVSDVKKSLLIEAVGYDSGYGQMHEIEVKKLFRGITDYNGLIKMHHAKHALIRLNSKGGPYKAIQRLKILKLKSLWESKG